jgi:Fur family iron response transcriptional regulator
MDDHPHFHFEDSGDLTDAPAGELEIRNLPEVPDGYEIAKLDVVIRLRKTS